MKWLPYLFSGRGLVEGLLLGLDWVVVECDSDVIRGIASPSSVLMNSWAISGMDQAERQGGLSRTEQLP